MPKLPDLRNINITTSSGTNVKSTSQLSGLASDSLSGKNSMKEATCESPPKGDLGGKNLRK